MGKWPAGSEGSVGLLPLIDGHPQQYSALLPSPPRRRFRPGLCSGWCVLYRSSCGSLIIYRCVRKFMKNDQFSSPETSASFPVPGYLFFGLLRRRRAVRADRRRHRRRSSRGPPASPAKEKPSPFRDFFTHRYYSLENRGHRPFLVGLPRHFFGTAFTVRRSGDERISSISSGRPLRGETMPLLSERENQRPSKLESSNGFSSGPALVSAASTIGAQSTGSVDLLQG